MYAIEKNEGDAANAWENTLRFQATNYTLRHGKAPEGLDAWPDPDAVFVGGSGGELAGLIDRILTRLKPNGRLLNRFVTGSPSPGMTRDRGATRHSARLSTCLSASSRRWMALLRRSRRSWSH